MARSNVLYIVLLHNSSQFIVLVYLFFYIKNYNKSVVGKLSDYVQIFRKEEFYFFSTVKCEIYIHNIRLQMNTTTSKQNRKPHRPPKKKMSPHPKITNKINEFMK